MKNGITVYLGIAIDKAVKPGVTAEEIIEALNSFSNTPITTFSPANAFNVSGIGEKVDDFIYQINEKALLEADTFLLHYVPGTESWGLPMEVYMAEEKGKPIFIFTWHEDEVFWDMLPTYLRQKTSRSNFFTIRFNSPIDWKVLAEEMYYSIFHKMETEE